MPHSLLRVIAVEAQVAQEGQNEPKTSKNEEDMSVRILRGCAPRLPSIL